ncbi:MAG: DUF4382 domain-containing protein [Dehalococcoidia bacterium]|nr:MAG: DUF4382 domain-containing protein [Dehalococcoidia bacterium]
MSVDINKILDECIDRINGGDSIESCLADYPVYSDQLKPSLLAIIKTKKIYKFVPNKEAKTAAKLRFDAAMEKRLKAEKDAKPWLSRVIGKPLTWAAFATITAVIIGIYLGVNPSGYPISPIVPQPHPEGNFAFLISDEQNAIGDFKSFKITITKIGLQINDGAREWIEFEPEVETVDLTLLPGENAQEIWRGNIPDGQYNKVFIYVTDIEGILIETNNLANVKLPSERLQISKPFGIESDSLVSFVYDVTVVRAGQSGQYIIKPQLDQSGVDQPFNEIPPAGKSDDAGPPKDKDKPEDLGKPDNTGKPKNNGGSSSSKKLTLLPTLQYIFFKNIL